MISKFNDEIEAIINASSSSVEAVGNYTVINASVKFINLRKEFDTDIKEFIRRLTEIDDVAVSWNFDEFRDDVVADDKSRRETGMKHQISETLHLTYTFLSLFLFRIPGLELGVPFSPEANHRKVVKDNFHVINEHTKHSLETSLRDGIHDGFDARKLVVYPYSITDVVNDRTPLCSVSMTNVEYPAPLNYKASSVVLKAGNLACDRSKSIDFIFLQIFLGMETLYEHSSNMDAWSAIAQRSVKFASEEDFDSFFYAASLPLADCFKHLDAVRKECKFVYIYSYTYIYLCLSQNDELVF